jgi:hypothetical protein
MRLDANDVIMRLFMTTLVSSPILRLATLPEYMYTTIFSSVFKESSSQNIAPMLAPHDISFPRPTISLQFAYQWET